MRRSNSQPIGELVRSFIRQEGLETPLNQFRLMEAWKDVMGHSIELYTGEMFIKNQTLFVKILSAPLRQNLMMTRTALVDRLNKAVDAQVITEIRFI